MNRIDNTFAILKQAGRSALITYIMGGDPDVKSSLSILKALPEAGADIIELGMPFSDPVADGPAIQEAAIRALESHTKMKDILGMVTEFRQGNANTPLILMGYYNPVFRYGVENFIRDAKKAGVDGLLIVDLPPEEDTGLYEATKREGLALIKLVTPTTDTKRLKAILPKASGFLYYVSVAGVTGTKSATESSIDAAVKRFKESTSLPLAVGFGIKTPEQAAVIAKTAEAVVVGSALVNCVKQYADKPELAKAAIIEQVRALAGALKK
ncbi:MAG: tryptophan synthase alpha chain [Rickettsiales bacterium]|jgi:tryptophan synthase alpha chain|nr:tryptophan synthase alpha chain [Rickettsiales bacterium]